jgi:hypothetical protein
MFLHLLKCSANPAFLIASHLHQLHSNPDRNCAKLRQILLRSRRAWGGLYFRDRSTNDLGWLVRVAFALSVELNSNSQVTEPHIE